MLRRPLLAYLILGMLAMTAPAALAAPPLDLWPAEVMAKIRDRATLNHELAVHAGYFDVYYDSEVGDAKWADGSPPYAIHSGGTIRVHGFLASPLVGGPYPAIVVGHGLGGHGSPEVELALAALGYVVLSIDGPGQGQSTGAPDTVQGWISVEEQLNTPAPELSYLYHYAYAGMRGLTLLDHLSQLPFNPLRIDRDRLGVIGASMGGQFTYYINGVDDRVKAAVAIAVAGDWRNLLAYEGSWLYHGFYYYTRDGLRSGQDALNTVSNVCTDPTLETFFSNFEPIQYAPRQHAPLLTIIGSHDQYFTLPSINTTFDRIASAGTNPRFLKRLMITPNGEHGVINENDLLPTLLPVLADIDGWLAYSFRNGATPPATPTVSLSLEGQHMRFRVSATAGGSSLRNVSLHYASQIDTLPEAPCDFARLELSPTTPDVYEGTLPVGTFPACGPAVTSDNVLYYASAADDANFTVSSKLYYRGQEMAFGSGFVPRIEHFYMDDLPVPPPAVCAP